MSALPRRSARVAVVAFGVLLPLTIAHTYQAAVEGACRGPGGELDKVNSKFIHERSAAACAQDCDDEPHCVGYSYHPTANGGECIAHGPGMAGVCSNNDAISPEACAALGNCADTTRMTETACGTCSEASAPTIATCASVLATWTASTWTSAGATWSDAADPWTGEWQSSVIISGVAPSAGYMCYDIDPTDHEAKCTGTAVCVAAFANKAADVQIAANCPSTCTFTAAVKATKVVTVHAPAIEMAGYTVKSGACRGPGSTKVNGKYSHTAGASGAQLTQEECAAACDAAGNCVGYAHSTACCIVYGPGVKETSAAGWTLDTHDSTIITGTIPNAAYICAVKGSSSGTWEDKKMASNARGLNSHLPPVLMVVVIASNAWMIIFSCLYVRSGTSL